MPNANRNCVPTVGRAGTERVRFSVRYFSRVDVVQMNLRGVRTTGLNSRNVSLILSSIPTYSSRVNGLIIWGRTSSFYDLKPGQPFQLEGFGHRFLSEQP